MSCSEEIQKKYKESPFVGMTVADAKLAHNGMVSIGSIDGKRLIRTQVYIVNMLDVDVKTPAGLSINPPDNHKALVLSKKYLKGAAILPNRVGLPITKPAQSFKSSRLA